MLHSAKENNMAGIVVMIDFEKALDSISFNLIQTTFVLIYFVDKFKNWIRIIPGMQDGNDLNIWMATSPNILKFREVAKKVTQLQDISS